MRRAEFFNRKRKEQVLIHEYKMRNAKKHSSLHNTDAKARCSAKDSLHG